MSEQHAEQESPTEEAAEDEETQVAEFANKFTLRRVDRSFVAGGVVIVTIVYNDDKRPSRPTEYDYYIPIEDYEYDKVKIAREIRRQHKQKKSIAGGTGGRKK